MDEPSPTQQLPVTSCDLILQAIAAHRFDNVDVPRHVYSLP